MKAIQVQHFGGPERLTLADVPVPRPGPGEVLVRLAHAGVNYIDVYMRDGSYARSHTYKTPLPMTLGMEGSAASSSSATASMAWRSARRLPIAFPAAATPNMPSSPPGRSCPFPPVSTPPSPLPSCCRDRRPTTSRTQPSR